ncbi:helix-turn-helix transcriptional regulator [Lentzea sp. DG1S-22]|uniref:helix-turn-helix domain-containing protein n=1 Tax=Lentzea sp. DG1S-22 TaxID=3108822 RepID=UPI002E77D4E4|nr:helix-turn-helix transcriptional regulator [Lentzea sp. DG1S-22]WVH80887.1 helix-turn-helix transcriptional regulator [Lentzea sp. DG1S-22]
MLTIHPPHEELADLLVTGPFADALRVAIQVRGLSLERLQHRLKLRGAPISVTALSYWQSGRRRPERPESLRALAQLEDVLGLPETALSRLLGPPRPRGRSRRRQTSARTPWDGSGLVLTAQHDRVEVAPCGGVLGVRSRQVMQARAADVDRWILCQETGSAQPALTAVRSCQVGRVARERTNGVLVAELVFDEPISTGDCVAIEYELIYPRPTAEHTHFRRFAERVHDYVLEIKFPAGSPPESCEQFASGPAGAELSGGTRPAPVDEGGYAHAAALDFGPGLYGMRWTAAANAAGSSTQGK